MGHDKIMPQVQPREGSLGGQCFTHPAFGEISVTKGMVSSGGMELFGSALKHRSVITVTLRTAHLDRHLNRDWIHSDQHVASFHMSESQWASFISSKGDGGTPITFEVRPKDGSEMMVCPGIESAESMRETYHRELLEKCEHYMQQAQNLASALADAAADGKAGKGRLQELRNMAEELSIGLPNTMSFIQKQAETAMEKTVQAGKTEIESFISDLATRTGLEVLREQSVKLIEDK